MISGLRPFTNYSLIVVAMVDDESRRGNTGWIQVITDEGGKEYSIGGDIWRFVYTRSQKHCNLKLCI